MARDGRRVIAVDTNVALRLILHDDDAQLLRIRAMIAEHRLYLPLTVMLETGWMLASRYQMKRHDMATAFTALLALDGIEVARAALMTWAIDRFRGGADWADMIHLVASSKLESFVTFDQRLERDADEPPPVPVTTLV